MPGQPPLDLVEPHAAEHHLAQDQRRPPLGQDLAAEGHRAVLAILTHPHDRRADPGSPWSISCTRHRRPPASRCPHGDGHHHSHLDHTHHGSTDHDPIRRSRTGRRSSSAGPASSAAQIAPYAADHDRDGTFVTEAFDLLRSSGYLAIAVPEELGGRGATIREVDHGPADPGPVVRVDGARLGDAPARHAVHGVAVPPRPAGRRGHAAPRRRRADRPRLDGRRRLHPSPRSGRPGRRRVQGDRPQGLRQPGPGRRRVLDDVRARRRPRAGGPQHGRAGARRRRHGARQLGHAGHARHREPRRRHRRRLRARGAGARPAPLRRRRPAAAGDRQHRHAGHRRLSTSASPRRPATPPWPPSPARRAPTTRRSSGRSGPWTTACA